MRDPVRGESEGSENLTTSLWSEDIKDLVKK